MTPGAGTVLYTDLQVMSFLFPRIVHYVTPVLSTYVYKLIQASQQPYEAGAITIPKLQIKKLRYREVMHPTSASK